MLKFNIGQKATISKIYTKEDIENFAKLSGDMNPIHIDNDYSKKTIFKKPIAHGILVASLISNVIGNKLPGEGSIYLNQVLKFIKPVFVDDRITATVVITELDNNKNLINLNTNCKNQDGNIVITGDAIVLFNQLI